MSNKLAGNSLFISKCGVNGQLLELDYGSIGYLCEPVVEADYLTYRDILSKILFDNGNKSEFIASATIGRNEGYTLFYDTLVKFHYLLEIIKNERRDILITNLKYPVLWSLTAHLKRNGIKFRVSRFNFIIKVQRYLRFFIKVAGMLLAELLGYVASNRNIPKNIGGNYEHLIISFYDYRANDNGKYRDQYFNEVHKHLLATKQRVLVVTTALFRKSPLRPLSYYRTIAQWYREIGQFNKECEVKTAYQIIGITDILALYWEGLFSRARISVPIPYKGEDISCLLNYSLQDEYFSGGWRFPYLNRRLFRKLFNTCGVGHILYPYENHPWEKMMILERNSQSGNTRFTGFQASSISLKYLQFFPGAEEMKLNLSPDKILTMGEVMKDFMYKYGHYAKGQVEVGCALRVGKDFQREKLKENSAFSRKIAVAFSIDMRRYQGIINTLNAVFDGSEFTVYLKVHPTVGDAFVEGLGPCKNLLLSSGKPWEEIFDEIDLLLYDDNTVGAEALRKNLPVGCLMVSGQNYDTDRLYCYPGEQAFIRSTADLRDCLDRHYACDPKKAWHDRLETNELYYRKYFYPVNAENIQKYC